MTPEILKNLTVDFLRNNATKKMTQAYVKEGYMYHLMHIACPDMESNEIDYLVDTAFDLMFATREAVHWFEMQDESKFATGKRVSIVAYNAR